MQLSVGTTLKNGKYRIIKVLGQGGFGITYLAVHTNLGYKIAIKEFFPKTYCDRNDHTGHVTVGTRSNKELVDKLKRRFTKEAQNLQHLDHDGIVKVDEIFEENGTSYYFMQYIEGDNLKKIVDREGKLSPEKAIEYVVKIGEALDYIHSKNMTHFDVKPSNIMIRKEDDRPILIDFGLSVQYTEEGDETTTNIGAASPGYSALEMYNTKNLQTFSPSTDVYSLAATLYFLLTGEEPPSAIELDNSKLLLPSYIPNDITEVIREGMLSRNKRIPTIKLFIEKLTSYLYHSAPEINNESELASNSEETIIAQLLDSEETVYGTQINNDGSNGSFTYRDNNGNDPIPNEPEAPSTENPDNEEDIKSDLSYNKKIGLIIKGLFGILVVIIIIICLISFDSKEEGLDNIDTVAIENESIPIDTIPVSTDDDGEYHVIFSASPVDSDPGTVHYVEDLEIATDTTEESITY